MSHSSLWTEQDRQELAVLIEDCVSGAATPEQVTRLDGILLAEKDARDFYVRYIDTLCSLKTWAESPADESACDTESAEQTPPIVVPPSPVLGFLGNLGSMGGSFTSTFWMLLVLAMGMAFSLALVFVLAIRGIHMRLDEAIAIQDPPTAASAAVIPRASVARLVRTYECVWAGADPPIADGDCLQAGQRLRLNSGLAEIVFDCEARVILQGPASFVPDSPRSALLSEGKVTIKAEAAAAKGFAIRTPSMKTVDLGTEFGLEVAPNGIEQVHVFRGEVEVAASSRKGPSAPPQRLVEKQGIEVDPNTQGVKLVANNGERFARSLDEAQNKRHVVAWWRFEDHPVGVLVPDSQEGRSPNRGSLDSSNNGNDLYTWNRGTQPRFSSDVPAATIGQTGEANTASLDNSVAPAHESARDLFTMSAWSRPSFTDLQAITPAKWTIEASIKLAKLNDRFQVFLIRDGMKVCKEDPRCAPLAFHVTPAGHFEIMFCDIAGRRHAAVAPAVTVEAGRWYHVAAVSDGQDLKLYVDSLDGNGYMLWAVTGLPSTDSTALARGEFPGKDPLSIEKGAGYPYIWSVGRGYYGGHVGNWFEGSIDEVRICDVALEPTEFLFSKPLARAEAGRPATNASGHRQAIKSSIHSTSEICNGGHHGPQQRTISN